MTSVEAKLFKLSEDPIFFQLYKRGDLIAKITANTLSASDQHLRRDLYNIIANEKAY